VIEVAARIAAVAVGIGLVVSGLISAFKTVVIPRPAVSLVTRWVFLGMRWIFLAIAPVSKPYARRDPILAVYAPLSMVATLGAWLVLTFVGFAGIFWGLEGDVGVSLALELSGSSLFTLGFVRPEGFGLFMVAFIEAAIGLFLLALLITYLPAMYSAFGRREQGVTALAVRAGEPPSGRELIWRYHALDRIEFLHDVWVDWERWFVELEESHTSLPALVFFRSPQPDHSWITAAGAVLDGAALAVSTVAIPRDVQAEFCIRAGYLALRRIADFFQVPYDPNPRPSDPISITRAEWEAAVRGLGDDGVPLRPDLDQAWRDFSGWRVNYDTVLLALANLTSAPYAEWSSDRSGAGTFRPRMFRGAVAPPAGFPHGSEPR
jgi:hypothetical protein